MKKVLIVNNNMHIGGVQKSLLNLLHEAALEYEITLLLFYDGGELREDIPANINVISTASPFRYFGMIRSDTVNLKDKFARSFLAAMTRFLGRKLTLKWIYPLQKKLGEYDIAISYLHSGDAHTFWGGCNEFVLHCVSAKKKMTFLHCDYGKINPDPAYNAEIYEKFDAIAACSSGCRTSFLKVMPQLAGKTMVVQNCHHFQEILEEARRDPVLLPAGAMNIVTVSRFGREKGILRAIQAIKNLDEKISDIRYYIIGDGIEFQKAAVMVRELHLSNKVFLLGEKKDPYGYMQAADLLLIPSFSEAAPMVIGEAACLGTPILSTETSSAREMVEETGFGWVCDNSEKGITDAIKELLSKPSVLSERKKFLQAQKFDNSVASEQFSKLVLKYADD